MNPSASHLAPGTQLAGGKYRIVRFIGAGGFGCTYEAEFVSMRSRVAIKEFFVSACCNREASGAVSVGIASQKGLVKRLEEKFRREAQRLFKLKHPGIVSVTDMIEENGTCYYVMDYIDGLSLQSVIDRDGPLPEARALRYIGQVMDALEYVHGQSMLHLDIKPDNIMIDGKDRAILIDFGVSKQYDEIDGYSTSTIMAQTPGYAPPEQADNSIKDFSPASDIYALGATLYCALTGVVPPSSAKLMSGRGRLAPLPAGTSASTHVAIGRMMQPRVDHRPQTISAVRKLLKMEDGKFPSGMANGKLKRKNADAHVGSRPVTTDANGTVPITASRGAATYANATVPIAASRGTATVIGHSTPKSKKWLWVVIVVVAVIAVVGVIQLFRGSSTKSGAPIVIADPISAETISTDTISADTVVESDTLQPAESSSPSVPVQSVRDDYQLKTPCFRCSIMGGMERLVVYFPYYKTYLCSAHKDSIDKIMKDLDLVNKDYKIGIVGYANMDEGTNIDNMQISKEITLSVVEYLVKKGVPVNNITSDWSVYSPYNFKNIIGYVYIDIDKPDEVIYEDDYSEIEL